jgi:hypothetical protein
MVRIIVAFALLGMFPLNLKAQAKTAPLPDASKTAITAAELIDKYVVIGPLGHPLGEVISIEGIAVENQGKGERELIEVLAVEGNSLERPIRMSYSIWPWGDIKSLETGKRYSLRVYQDGGFSGVPSQVMEETVGVQTRGYGFITNLVVVRSVRDEKREQLRP